MLLEYVPRGCFAHALTDVLALGVTGCHGVCPGSGWISSHTENELHLLVFYSVQSSSLLSHI